MKRNIDHDNGIFLFLTFFCELTFNERKILWMIDLRFPIAYIQILLKRNFFFINNEMTLGGVLKVKIIHIGMP